MPKHNRKDASPSSISKFRFIYNQQHSRCSDRKGNRCTKYSKNFKKTITVILPVKRQVLSSTVPSPSTPYSHVSIGHVTKCVEIPLQLMTQKILFFTLKSLHCETPRRFCSIWLMKRTEISNDFFEILNRRQCGFNTAKGYSDFVARSFRIKLFNCDREVRPLRNRCAASVLGIL